MQYIEQREQLLDENWDSSYTGFPVMKERIKSFHRQSLEGLIEVVERKIEGMKKDGIGEYEDGYNRSVSDLLNYLEEMKK